jgi:alkylation response protein AidB-like acyl-CoA dehydrogenase
MRSTTPTTNPSVAGDFRYNAVLCEELGKVSMSLSSCHGIHADIVAPYLVELTNEEQRERWLPGFVSGEILTAIAMTEPSGGSDLAALKTTAVLQRHRQHLAGRADRGHPRFLDNAVLAHAKGELTPVDAAKVKWWRDARVSKIWAGSNEIMKEVIGRDLGL